MRVVRIEIVVSDIVSSVRESIIAPVIKDTFTGLVKVPVNGEVVYIGEEVQISAQAMIVGVNVCLADDGVITVLVVADVVKSNMPLLRGINLVHCLGT